MHAPRSTPGPTPRVTAALTSATARGLAAGLAGTAAMTVSSTAEMRLRHREASSAPADAAAAVLGIGSFTDEAARQRFATLVHWGYGTGWGAVHALLRVLGAPPPVATAGHYAAVWGGAQVALPALDVAPPVLRWPPREVAIDAWHHLVYAVVTAAAYRWLERRAARAG